MMMNSLTDVLSVGHLPLHNRSAGGANMDRYETMKDYAEEHGLSVEEKPLKYNDGRIRGNKVLIRSDIPTRIQKAAVLCEEIGHYETAVGNILDQSVTANRKQELRGRIWAYNRLIGLTGIIKAYRSGCRNRYEMAELLEVPEDVLQDALDYYHSRYGLFTQLDNYVIYFEPLGVMELV